MASWRAGELIAAGNQENSSAAEKVLPYLRYKQGSVRGQEGGVVCNAKFVETTEDAFQNTSLRYLPNHPGRWSTSDPPTSHASKLKFNEVS